MGVGSLGMTGSGQRRTATGAPCDRTEYDRDLGGASVDNLCATCCEGVDTARSSGDSAVDNSAGAVDSRLRRMPAAGSGTLVSSYVAE